MSNDIETDYKCLQNVSGDKGESVKSLIKKCEQNTHPAISSINVSCRE